MALHSVRPGGLVAPLARGADSAFTIAYGLHIGHEGSRHQSCRFHFGDSRVLALVAASGVPWRAWSLLVGLAACRVPGLQARCRGRLRIGGGLEFGGARTTSAFAF